MTIDEAIKHCLETAEQLEERANIPYKVEDSELQDNACRECAADHRQLAEWLTELKQWRRVYGICPSYEMCIPECKEGYNAQIAEYKRLLKAAVEDMHVEDMCDVCVKRIPNSHIHCPDGSNCFVWRYKEETEKLIGGSENG